MGTGMSKLKRTVKTSGVHCETDSDRRRSITIVPGVYIGNFRDAKDVEKLTANNITHILSIHDNAKKILDDKEYLCIEASDTPSQDLLRFFPECIEFIHQARLSGGGVLIHCLAGVSRSVTVTAAYLMTVTTLGWRDTLNAIRGARNVANPNFGFQKQLQTYENEGLEEARRKLKEKYPENKFKDDHDLRQLLHCYRHYVLTGETTTSSSEVPNYDDDGLYPLPHNAYNTKVRTGMLVADFDDEEPSSQNSETKVKASANSETKVKASAARSQSKEDEKDDKELASSVDHLHLDAEVDAASASHSTSGSQQSQPESASDLNPESASAGTDL